MIHDAEVEALARMQGRVGAAMTTAIVVVYFGFVLLVAFFKPLLARPLVPGLSLGILIGALVIVFAWLLTGLYVRWANRVYDAEVARLRARKEA